MFFFKGESKPFVRNVFSLRRCSAIVGSHVLSFNKERDMLVAWKNMVLKTDPDIFTGYNIENFDFWYLMERANKLKVFFSLFFFLFFINLLIDSFSFLSQ